MLRIHRRGRSRDAEQRHGDFLMAMAMAMAMTAMAMAMENLQKRWMRGFPQESMASLPGSAEIQQGI
jgi:hypothetical protein